MYVKNDEYTKMSIHCHLGGEGADCKIDRSIEYVPCFNLNMAYESIDEAAECGFRLLAQTNSNYLDAASWRLVREYAKRKDIEVLPGVEVNLKNWKNEKRVLHVVLVFSPDSDLASLTAIMKRSFEKNHGFFLSIDQIGSLLHGTRSVICVHGGVKQGKRNIRNNPEMASEVVGFNRFYPVAFEDNKAFHKTVLVEKLKGFLDEQQAEWLEKDAADVSAADRIPFSEIESPTYLWASNTFDDLYYCVLTGASRIVREENIVTRPLYISRIIIDRSAQMESSEINCSQGLNCIIGPSGSGKTLLLDILKYKMRGEHLTESSSSSGNYEGMYNPADIHLYGPDGTELDFGSAAEVIEGQNLYQKVIRAYVGSRAELVNELGLGIDIGGFTKLVEDFSREAKKYLSDVSKAKRSRAAVGTTLAQAQSAQRFIDANDVEHANTIEYIADSSTASQIQGLETAREICSQDLASIKKAFETLREIAVRNGFASEVVKTIDALEKTFTMHLLARANQVDQSIGILKLFKEKQDLIYNVCHTYNGEVSVQSQQLIEKKQVLADKLEELAMNLLDSQRHIFQAKVPTLDEEAVRNSISLNSDSNSSKLRISKVKLSLDNEDDFLGAFGTVVSKRRVMGKVKVSMLKPCSLSKAADVKSLLDIFADNGISDDFYISLSHDAVFTYSIELADENGTFRPIEEFSAGMLSKVYVSHFLDDAISDAGSSTVILYDQPESNMEKAFLNATLSDKFSKLRKSHQIFVATHEPLLVVNADANEIILASNEKMVNQPNRVSYVNRSFVGTNGKASLIEEVANLIDGGTNAVNHRNSVYEGMTRR